jgi:hypothetical protein
VPAQEVDPFELPDWLGEEQVLWQATGEREHTATVPGRLSALRGSEGNADAPEPLTLDLLAVDVAWPKPVCDQDTRHLAHESWHYDQVALLDRGGRVTLGVPGTEFTSDLVCEAVRRFSKAVGAEAHHFLVQLRL